MGINADVIGSPTDAEGGLFSEINDNSVAILLTYGTARILPAGDAEANEEEYMSNGLYTGPLTIVNVPNLHTLRARVPRSADQGWHPADGSCESVEESLRPAFSGGTAHS